MVSRFIAGLICAASLTAGEGAFAQEFRIFDHDHGLKEESGGESFSGESSQRSEQSALAFRTVAPGYREAIYLPLIREAELRHRLPPRLLQALIWAESRFNPLAVSPAGAAGLAQLMPATARELGVANRHDPQENIDGGARYLRQMLDRFGSVHLALAAYNAGPGAVTKAGGIPRNRETPGYVRSVLGRWMSYAN
jgi:soluble lytic murein transglycosylase-like protein